MRASRLLSTLLLLADARVASPRWPASSALRSTPCTATSEQLRCRRCGVEDIRLSIRYESWNGIVDRRIDPRSCTAGEPIQLGPEVEVLTPPASRDRMMELVRALVRPYAIDPVGASR